MPLFAPESIYPQQGIQESIPRPAGGRGHRLG